MADTLTIKRQSSAGRPCSCGLIQLHTLDVYEMNNLEIRRYRGRLRGLSWSFLLAEAPLAEPSTVMLLAVGSGTETSPLSSSNASLAGAGPGRTSLEVRLWGKNPVMRKCEPTWPSEGLQRNADGQRRHNMHWQRSPLGAPSLAVAGLVLLAAEGVIGVH